MTDLGGRATLWVGERLNRRGFVGRFGRMATLATFAAVGVSLAAPGIASADCSSCSGFTCCDGNYTYCCSYNLGSCPSTACDPTPCCSGCC